MAFQLPDLPFPKNALEPVMSAETFDYHHGKHHRAYVNKLNELIPGTEFEKLSLEEIIRKSSGPVFNNSAQVWNHTFFWHCLTPNGREPGGELRKAIEKTWGSLDAFKEKFAAAGVGQFGSGWAWLVKNADGSLAIETTGNAATPITTQGKIPLLTCDVWEHAYYVDYRNDRAKFLQSVWKLLNWEFAEKNFAANDIFKA